MKSLFGDLDQLIEQAVAKATNTEKSLQAKQVKAIKTRGLEADTGKKGEVEEADDDKDKGDESIEKIKGKVPVAKSEKSSPDEDKKSDIQPGTQTSKKLVDPSQKIISDPQFIDFKNKINILRGSGSLADEKVANSVKIYLSKLTPAEKSALLTYLTNLAQIMTAVKSPKQVSDPQKQGIKITYVGKNDKQKEKMTPAQEKGDNLIVVGEK